jgi:hypothetical protein
MNDSSNDWKASCALRRNRNLREGVLGVTAVSGFKATGMFPVNFLVYVDCNDFAAEKENVDVSPL